MTVPQKDSSELVAQLCGAETLGARRQIEARLRCARSGRCFPYPFVTVPDAVAPGAAADECLRGGARFNLELFERRCDLIIDGVIAHVGSVVTRGRLSNPKMGTDSGL